MEAALGDDHRSIVTLSYYGVNYPVLVIDAAGPVAFLVTTQGFRFSDPFKRMAPDIFQKFIDPRSNLRIGALPVNIILPAVRVEGNPHIIRRSRQEWTA